MSISKISFFNPSANLPAWAGEGQWLIQSEENETRTQRASVLDGAGNEAAAALYGAKITRSLALISVQAEGSLKLPALGSLVDEGGLAWHVDGFSLELTPTGWPSLSLSLHAHPGRPHGKCRSFTPSLSIPAGRGVPRDIAGFAAPDMAIAIAAFTYRCSLRHVEAADGAGEFLAADNCEGSEQVSLATVGAGALTVPAGWSETTSEENRENTSHDSTAHTYVKAAVLK